MDRDATVVTEPAVPARPLSADFARELQDYGVSIKHRRANSPKDAQETKERRLNGGTAKYVLEGLRLSGCPAVIVVVAGLALGVFLASGDSRLLASLLAAGGAFVVVVLAWQQEAFQRREAGQWKLTAQRLEAVEQQLIVLEAAERKLVSQRLEGEPPQERRDQPDILATGADEGSMWVAEVKHAASHLWLPQSAATRVWKRRLYEAYIDAFERDRATWTHRGGVSVVRFPLLTYLETSGSENLFKVFPAGDPKLGEMDIVAAVAPGAIHIYPDKAGEYRIAVRLGADGSIVSPGYRTQEEAIEHARSFARGSAGLVSNEQGADQ